MRELYSTSIEMLLKLSLINSVLTILNPEMNVKSCDLCESFSAGATAHPNSVFFPAKMEAVVACNSRYYHTK